MADNIILNLGSGGDLLAADDDGTAKHHDHTNGRVRGLLCLNCNTALGQFKDSTSLLLKAADYLEGFK